MTAVSIILCTANRAEQLGETLTSLASVRTPLPTELLVMDNRSVDRTRDLVHEAARSFPFPIRYIFAEEPGKYAALNAGIKASKGRIVVATDDDVRFEDGWLEQAVQGLASTDYAFVGGPVRPLWQGPKPAWLNEQDGMHSKVVALLDYGRHEREFGRGISWPLGVNVAYRREVFDLVGFFDNRLGRMTGTLRNQAQREWHLRARDAGLRGLYLPDMVVHHLVPNDRMNKQYFRRWLYWHGISRALLYRFKGVDVEEPEVDNPPHAGEPTLAGVPRHLYASAARSIRSFLWRWLTGRRDRAFNYELWLCFFAGVVRQRWADRNRPIAPGPATLPQSFRPAVAARSADDYTPAA